MAIDIQNFSKAKPPLQEREADYSAHLFSTACFYFLSSDLDHSLECGRLATALKWAVDRVVDSHPVASARLLADKTNDVCGALLIKQTKFELNI